MQKNTTIKFYRLKKTAYTNASVLSGSDAEIKSGNNDNESIPQKFKMIRVKKPRLEELPMD